MCELGKEEEEKKLNLLNNIIFFSSLQAINIGQSKVELFLCFENAKKKKIRKNLTEFRGKTLFNIC